MITESGTVLNWLRPVIGTVEHAVRSVSNIIEHNKEIRDFMVRLLMISVHL